MIICMGVGGGNAPCQLLSSLLVPMRAETLARPRKRERIQAHLVQQVHKRDCNFHRLLDRLQKALRQDLFVGELGLDSKRAAPARAEDENSRLSPGAEDTQAAHVEPT